ncbi:hypothetical protein PF005_g5378 [Phytophthora fragariae]|uniref:Uncharacterized protein n=1 Tax=Phytophthora fragariae TaxID=53985 RepID=A0A6A3TCP1_9STRA|nr:hypothetical protein PF009_g6062 [Phytophthora fragariae]KAE9128566.1 hypothetical protein PF007_g5226 [Phytophthora fragariae]KAE9133522.1 hypothetical protein PF006_g15014 [Phytophthora fragariae]KAE9186991.1 hypothetical protein PF004_g22929 [Phytophthora fragariae]KAE9196606.1 hypothetical protein PF002_g23003 [Phytophthora fragariae]
MPSICVTLLCYNSSTRASAAPARGSCNISNVVRVLAQVTLTQCRGINPLRAVHPSFFGIPSIIIDIGPFSSNCEHAFDPRPNHHI